MAAEAVGLHVQEGRPASLARPDNRLHGLPVGRRGVVSVHRDAGDPVRGGPHGEIVHRCGAEPGRELGVLVVFAHEHHPQAVGGGEVERLVEGPLVDAPVPEEAHRHLAGAPVAGGEGRPGGDTQPAGHDPVGPQHPDREVGHMHRTSPAPAGAGCLAVQLRHDRTQLHALGDGVAVAAVGGGDVVVTFQGGAHAGGDGLLADIGVDETG